MFNKIEYVGFVNHPGLLALAERGTQFLCTEISPDLHSSVEVSWEAHQGSPIGLELRLILTLPTGIGTSSRFIPEGEFADEGLLRSRCRNAWDRALGALLEKRKEAWEELSRQPVEV